jgi:hypothetical protein
MPGQPLREVISLFGFKLDKKSWSKADRAVNKMRSGLLTLGRMALGGAGVYGFYRMTQAVVDTGHAIDKTSSKLGVSTDALQEFHHAANLSGVAVQSFNMGLQRMARRAAEAAEGKGEAKDALRELGIQLRNSDGSLRSTEDLFMDVAGAMGNVRDSNKRLRLAFKLFDSEGVALVNMLKNGKQGLQSMREEARVLGAVIDEDLIRMTVSYKDESMRMWQAIGGVRDSIVKGLLPGMLATVKAVKEWLVVNKQWLASNISDALSIAGRALQRAGEFAQFMLYGLKSLLGVLDPFQRKLLLVAGIMGLLSMLLGVWPALAIAAFLAIEDIVGFFEGKKSVTGQIVEWLKELYGQLAEAPMDPENGYTVLFFQAIAKAIDWVNESLDKLSKKLAEPIGDLVYGRGPFSFEKLQNVTKALPGAKEADELAGKFEKAHVKAAEGALGWINSIPGVEALNRLGYKAGIGVPPPTERQAAISAKGPSVQSNVTVQQTINPPAGTSSAEVADMAGRKAAESVSAAERREAMRVFAPQVTGQ